MADIPIPPPGFELVQPPAAGAVPPPPPGFVLDDGFKAPSLTVNPNAGVGQDSLRIDMTKQSGTGEGPSLVERIMDAAGGIGAQGLIGARKGVSTVLGLPVDLVSLIMNAGIAGTNKLTGSEIPYIRDPIGGSESIDKVFVAPARAVQSVVGKPTEDPKPRDWTERLARRTGEEVGAATVPIVGAIAKGARVGVEGARELPFLERMFVEPAAVAPTTFATKEGAGAVAAGTAAGLAGEASGRNKALAEGQKTTTGQDLTDMGAAFAGYGGGAAGARILSAGKDVLGAVFGSPKLTNKTARDVATDEIARAAGLEPGRAGVVDTGPLIMDLSIPNKTFDAIPGYKPTTADLTANPGLATREYSAAQGPSAGAFKRQRDENTQAVDRAMETNAPQGQPGTFKDALEIERDTRIGAASTARATAEDEARAAVQPLTPRTDRVERGNTIRGEAETAQAAARQATRDAYDAADVNALPLQPTFLAEALDRTTQGLSQVERTMAPQGLIDRIAQMPAGEPATLREATSLRTILLDQQRAALADPGRRYEARVLGQYIEAVEDVIGQSVSAEQRALLEQARAARRAEAEAFERKGDPIRDITATNPGGVPKMRDENVARSATRDDTIGRLFEEADTPATRQAIREELLSNADTSTAAGLHAFQQQYARQIARFPGLNDEFNTAIQARIRENTARGAEGGVLKEIGQDGRGVVARYLQYGDENAEKAMRAVLANKDPARAIDELLTFVGDNTAAVEGARKVFWDLMKKDTKSAGSTTGTARDNVKPYIPGQLKAFLDDPAKAAVMERLYRDNPEHLENIRKVADAVQNIEVSSRGRAAGSSGTTQGMQSILPSAETISSRAFALQRGQVGPTFLAVNMLSIIARKAVARQQGALIGKIVDKAIYQAEAGLEKTAPLTEAMAPMVVRGRAATGRWLKENNPANRAAMSRGAKGWMGNEAGTMIDLLQPDDDVKGAVMRPK